LVQTSLCIPDSRYQKTLFVMVAVTRALWLVSALMFDALAISAGQACVSEDGKPLPKHNAWLQIRTDVDVDKPDPITGAWEAEDIAGRHCLNECLAQATVHLLQSRNATSLGDFGAGNGEYSRFWKQHDIQVYCVDGNPSIVEASSGMCSQMDLTKAHDDIPQVDFAVSLEVAEHIPAWAEQQYLANLHNANKIGIIISWAQPGQTGNGHVNLKPLQDVIAQFTAMGYEMDTEATTSLRDAADCKPEQCNGIHFARNVLVFNRVARAVA